MSSEDQEELSPEELVALLGSFMPDIPGYRVMRRIGKGGMSQVYLGVQESLDRQVAIKIMDPAALTDEITKQRFEQEARTIAKLEHPCIVGIHEVGRTSQGLLYYVLPYLAKGHLGQRDFSHDDNRVVEVLRALLSALEYAHARGIVHRDVKAENVLFDNADRPLLTDFGIALARRDTSRITTAGIAVGSGGYMAPEQARGEAVDGRADLYAVGVLAFELLTGHLPFMSTDPLGLALMHAQDPIPRLPAERKRWQPFIDRAMAKSAENRYRNAQQMLAALNQLVPSDGKPVEEPVAVSAPASGKRNFGQPVILVLLSLVVLAGSVALYKQRQAKSARPPEFYSPSQTDPGKPSSDAASAITTEAPPPPRLVVETPAPTVPTAAPADATTPAPVDAVAIEPAAIVPALAPAPGTAGFASVSASASFTLLNYDPLVPGARQLVAAKRQLAQKRLSTPPGDNAVDSLLALRKLDPENAELPALAEQVVGYISTSVLDAIKNNRDDLARSAYQRTQKLAKDLGRQDGVAWKKLRTDLLAPLISRLEKSTRAQDLAGIDRSKALAVALEVEPRLLEPAWSSAKIEKPKAKPGDVLKGDGPTMVLVTTPDAGRAGLAFMREEVNRGDYATFVSGTGRGPAKCTNRLAQLFSAKRSWNDPGFVQTNQHPVVCVSYGDALAYSQWLSQRTGVRYRLPTATEWQRVAGYGGGADPCRNGQISCGSRGTAPGSGFPASPLGLHDLQGNVSEWLSDTGAGGRHLAAGASWRDVALNARQAPKATPDDRGHDDVGFRLVRDVGANELGQ